MRKNNTSPFLLQRQMMTAIKQLPREKKRLLAEYQLRLVSDFSQFPIEALRRKYEMEVR